MNAGLEFVVGMMAIAIVTPMIKTILSHSKLGDDVTLVSSTCTSLTAALRRSQDFFCVAAAQRVVDFARNPVRRW